MVNKYDAENQNKVIEDYIRYPLYNKIISEIERCKQLTKITNEPKCMSLEGEPGAGKTTLVRNYAKLFPRQTVNDGIEISVFYAELPSPVTVKSTASALLSQLGDPGAEKGTLWSMTHRLVGLIIDCKVQFVILDEFSNLIDRETNHVLNVVSDWLKMLIKQTGVPFLVVGITGKVDRILNSNEQLSRLFAFRETITPLEWNKKEPINEFSMFFGNAIKLIGKELSPSIPMIELCERVHYSTNGVVGNIMNLLIYSSIIAKERGNQYIELSDFCIAFENSMSKHLPEKTNPFKLPEGEFFIPNNNNRQYSSNQFFNNK